MKNSAMPPGRVIPELAYDDVEAAANWLCDAFGFTLRIRFGGHRAQLNIGGDGAMVAVERVAGAGTGHVGHDHSVLVAVDDVDAHAARAQARGARIAKPPQDYPYGERQYTVIDLGGHQWTFSQSIADIDARAFGAVVGTIER